MNFLYRRLKHLSNLTLPLSSDRVIVPLPTVSNHRRGWTLKNGARLLSNNSDPFLIRAPVSLSSLFVLPFSFPQGLVAFMASNYRLYQSNISPHILVDLSRHLKGRLIALCQVCARPLKEKAGRKGATLHTPVCKRTHLSLSLSSPSFCLFHHFSSELCSFLSPLLNHSENLSAVDGMSVHAV